MPEALRTYLDALIAGEHQTAYDRTGLRRLATTSDEAATLSFAHFRAFHLGDPLESYAVSEVTKLDRRSIDTVQQAGSPYFVVDLTLKHRSGTIDTTISVDGEVLGVVEIDPIPVRLRLPPTGVLTVDGVAATVPDAGTRQRSGPREHTILVLAGAHTISIGSASVRIRTSPLTVVSGPATIADGVVVIG